jgi:hypothetical protein
MRGECGSSSDARGGHAHLPMYPMVVVWCEEQRPTWLFDIPAVSTLQDHAHFTSTHGDEAIEV